MTNYAHLLRVIVLASVFAVLWSGPALSQEAPGHLDHVILGVADLDEAVIAFEKATGVRPTYGGKHPTGTHNALVSLGDRVYLEILAVQPDVAPPPNMAMLPTLKAPTPVGWAVGGSDLARLQQTLEKAGFTSTEPRAGSRVTPTGLTLRWQAFGLKDGPPEAPFFIVWDPDTKHPSTTSPAGCSLRRMSIAGPQTSELKKLRDALKLPVDIGDAKASTFTLTLACPKGVVSFGPP